MQLTSTSLDDLVLYKCTTTTTSTPQKQILYRGEFNYFFQDGTDDASTDNDDVLTLQCGQMFYPVFGQHFERFEDGLFMCTGDNNNTTNEEDEIAATQPGFVTLGFKLSSSMSADAFQDLLVEHTLFTDKRKCYAAKKVEEGTKFGTDKISQGTKLFGKTLTSGSSFLKSKMKKHGTGTGTKELKLTKTSKAVSSVKQLSGTAAAATSVVTTVVVKKSIESAHYVGDKVNHLSYVKKLKQKRRLAAQKKKGKPLSRVDKLMKGATEVVVALGTGGLSVFVAMNDAADVILDESIEAIGDVVEHKYGEEAGKVVEDALAVGVDGIKIARTVDSGAKNIAKDIAKSAACQSGAALVGDVIDTSENGSNTGTGSKK
jgi:hypothetical protein